MTLGKDVRVVAGKVDAEVKSLIGVAEKHFARRRFDASAIAYGDALAAYGGPADARAIVGSLSAKLREYTGKFHLLPWNKPHKAAAKFVRVQADAGKVLAYGDASSVIRKSEQALATQDRKTFEELFGYAKDLMTRIWFPFHHEGLSGPKHAAMTAKVESDSWKLAEHYVKVGHGDKAAAFFRSAKAPTISSPGFERELREVLIYDKYDILGAIHTPALAGSTIDGTNGAVQAVNPTALVAFAEKHGFGAEAGSTLVMALNGQRSHYRFDTPNVTLGGLVADALNLGR